MSNTRERAEEWCNKWYDENTPESWLHKGAKIIRDLLAECSKLSYDKSALNIHVKSQDATIEEKCDEIERLKEECERLESKHLEKGFPYQSLKQTVAEQAEKIERLKDELTYEVKDWKRIYELRIQEAIRQTAEDITQILIDEPYDDKNGVGDDQLTYHERKLIRAIRAKYLVKED